MVNHWDWMDVETQKKVFKLHKKHCKIPESLEKSQFDEICDFATGGGQEPKIALCWILLPSNDPGAFTLCRKCARHLDLLW